jgi:murein DD-endopeptidase MepM/ murein hydrolase activator NlpD
VNRWRGSWPRALLALSAAASGWERADGRLGKPWHPPDLMTVYAHTLENLVRGGDRVEPGQVIASAGSTGRATAPHLHFEVRRPGRQHDPLHWLREGDALASAAPLRSPVPAR